MAIKWSAEYLDRRMAEHKLWQHAVEHALTEEIIAEVQKMPKRKPRNLLLFNFVPSHLEDEPKETPPRLVRHQYELHSTLASDLEGKR